MMPYSAVFEGLLGRVAREVRMRRAERAAWRGALWGSVAAACLLAAREWLGDDAIVAALAVLLLGIVVPAAASAARPVSRMQAARLADRAYGLNDRIATSIEWTGLSGRTALVDALLQDTASRIESLAPKPVLERTRPREYRWLPLPLFAVAALLLAPPLPNPVSWLNERLASDSGTRDKRLPSPLEELARLFRPDLKSRDQLSARDAAKRAAENKAQGGVDVAEFKDRSMAKQATDFASFVKKGDDRLRLLDRTDRLPDLQSDFASSQYRTLLRRSQDLSAGKGPNRISKAKLGQILKEMERLGRKGGDWSEDAQDGLEALEEGQMDEAMEAMESALGKLKNAEERQRASRNLKGGRDMAQGHSGDDRDAAARRDQDGRGSYSLAQSKSAGEKGKPSARLRSTPYDSGVQGQRRGRMPSVDTQMASRPGASNFQAQYLGEVGQYRRLMEDAIAREQIPRAYHDQIRDYFKSLNDQ